jgi:hypothetical protein
LEESSDRGNPTSSWQWHLIIISIGLNYHLAGELADAVDSEFRSNGHQCFALTIHVAPTMNFSRIDEAGFCSVNFRVLESKAHETLLLLSSAWKNQIVCNETNLHPYWVIER